MTKDQEKELFDTLSNLLQGVNGIRSDVRDVKIVLDKHSQVLGEHSRILGEHSRILGDHTRILGDHSRKLDDHSSILNTLVAKVDSIAETVITNDKRLGIVEKQVDELRGEIH